ncbi:sulfotransferase 1A1-like [Diadema antillarum]|uniref:sulfotransferase 1A1-like n=1 Tax=Diadema antillarum TaxID=105358 RepID=UPI003A89DBB0
MASSTSSPEKLADGEQTSFSTAVPECVRKSCYEYRGVIMPNFMPLRCMTSLENMTVRPDDTFVITYPKSGTTWMQQIMLLVTFEGDISKIQEEHVTLLIPFLDLVDIFHHPHDWVNAPSVVDMVSEMPSPRMMKTHSPNTFLPLEIKSDDPKVKVIYVARNPKDAAVSYYHFCRFIEFLPTYESWDVFFEEFLAGRAPQGSWFENVLPWWKRRNHPNVLFLTYEGMKKDHRGAVEKVARFMGKSLTDDVIDRIVEASTFSSMKKSSKANPDSVVVISDEEKKKGSSFMRKGAIGDWKNYFTEDQNRRFDELYAKEMAGSGLELQFE